MSRNLQIQEKTVADEIQYKETISVYKLAGNDTKQTCTITRTYEHKETIIKNYQIRTDSSQIIYAEGYSSYTVEGAEFVSTEEEFYDRVNAILSDASMECIHLNPIMWESRWDAVNIEKNETENDVVKAEFSYSEPITNENGDEVTVVTIRMNDEEEQRETESGE